MIVVKVGGALLESPTYFKRVLASLADLYNQKVVFILVHGSGTAITKRLTLAKRESVFVDGYRVTDQQTLSLVEQELTQTNQRIVDRLIGLSIPAVSVLGNKNDLLIVKKHQAISGVDLGLVGQVETVNVDVLNQLLQAGVVPVVAPLGISPSGQTFNLNADDAASAVAQSVRAKRLVLLTNTDGVKDSRGRRIKYLTADRFKELIATGVVSSGMIAKLRACFDSLEFVDKIQILDGKNPDILVECLREGDVGTTIRRL